MFSFIITIKTMATIIWTCFPDHVITLMVKKRAELHFDIIIYCCIIRNFEQTHLNINRVNR